MSKIFYILGKSCVGKDTIYRRIMQDNTLQLKRVVPYTTRPQRSGEKSGMEYYFVDEQEFTAMKQEGRIIEDRAYNTVHGLWRYFTADDEQLLDMKMDGASNYLMIGVLESFVSTRDYFGKDKVIPLFVDLDDGERLQRALKREMQQAEPKYQELCRRYLADSEDFSEDKIIKAGIEKRFYNNDLEECVGSCIQEINRYI